MFFLLRCGFWLAVVAMATPWALLQDDTQRLVSGAGSVWQVAAVVAPSVLASSPAASGCRTKPGRCGDELASNAAAQDEGKGEGEPLRAPPRVKADLIGMTLELGEGARGQGRQQASPAVPARRVATRSKPAIDPITAELQRFARRD